MQGFHRRTQTPTMRAPRLARAAAKGARDAALTTCESSGPVAAPAPPPPFPAGAGAEAVPAKYPVDGTVAMGNVVGVMLDVCDIFAVVLVELLAVLLPLVGAALAEPLRDLVSR